MTLIAVPIAVSDPAEVADALHTAQDVRLRGADVIEWRVDTLADAQASGTQSVGILLADSPAQTLLTARSDTEGGLCTLDDEALADWFGDLLDAGCQPNWVDVEFDRWQRSAAIQAVAKRWQAEGVRVLFSSHEYTGRPTDLHQRIAAMQEAPCDAVKMVWRARSLRDGLECRDILASRQKPMIVLCMGPAGVMSRIMTGAWGGLLTFASSSVTSMSAPGQPTIDELLHQYRFRQLDQATAIYGLIGDPLGRSPGFVMHNHAFDQAGVNAVYLPMPVAAGWDSLKATLAELVGRSDIEFRGASVTLPHKQDLVRYAKEQGGVIADIVDRCGAANTLSVDADGEIAVDNTDVMGIVKPLLAMGFEPNGSKVAILGAGGVARAAVAALLPLGATVHVFNRTPARVATLVEAMQPFGSVHVGSVEAGPFNAIVQGTPIGMAHGDHPQENPLEVLGLDATVMMAPGSVAVETIYDPVETPFVVAMREVGTNVATGQDMWLAQAAEQLQRWTGRSPAKKDWTL